MDDNWWPWRRGDRDEGLPPPSRRHGARSVVGGGGTGRPAAARERRADRWVGGWLVLGGSDGVSVGRPPCCCGVRACRRRVVVTRACGCVRARATRPSEPAAAAADETLALGHGRRRPTVNNNNITRIIIIIILYASVIILYIIIYVCVCNNVETRRPPARPLPP